MTPIEFLNIKCNAQVLTEIIVSVEELEQWLNEYYEIRNGDNGDNEKM